MSGYDLVELKADSESVVPVTSGSSAVLREVRGQTTQQTPCHGLAVEVRDFPVETLSSLCSGERVICAGGLALAPRNCLATSL